MINDKADEFIEKGFQLLFYRYQIGLETPIKGSEFAFVFIYYIKNAIK